MHKYLKEIGIKDSPCFPSLKPKEIAKMEHPEPKNASKKQLREHKKLIKRDIKNIKEDIDEHGISIYEIMNMDFTSACYIYEHLMYYLEYTSFTDIAGYNIPVLRKCTDDSNQDRIYDTFWESHTFYECIRICTEYLKFYIVYFDKNDIKQEQEAYEKLATAFRIYAEIVPALWY